MERQTQLMRIVTELLQAQSQAIASRAQAVAVQHLPSPSSYTGEGDQARDDTFDHWFEHFEERAKLAGWNSEQKFCKLKLLLDTTAHCVFRTLSETEHASYEQATQALQRRFRPVDIK